VYLLELEGAEVLTADMCRADPGPGMGKGNLILMTWPEVGRILSLSKEWDMRVLVVA